MSDALMNTYGTLPVSFVRGNGAWLWDSDDKTYLDLLTGVAVCTLGHVHPKVTKAICEQANTLVHTSNWFHIPKQQQLAGRLAGLSGMDKVFFANSGAEANEAAIKMARLHGHKMGISDPSIIVTDSSFHGRTMATLTATGNRKVQAGFEPLVSGFVRVPFDDVDAIQAVADNRRDVCAILVEPIQGEGGVHVPADDYLVKLREICDTNGWLLILDEIQTGIGRTGAWFDHQHSGIKPDIMTLAKALGNGMPIGACVAKGEAADLFQPGHHGSTFGGNPLACAASLAVLDTWEQDQLITRAARIGDKLLSGLWQQLEDVAGVVAIRGRGLIWGIELERPAFDIIKLGLEKGIILNVTADKVIRLLPPVILTDEEVDKVINDVSDLIKTYLSED